MKRMMEIFSFLVSRNNHPYWCVLRRCVIQSGTNGSVPLLLVVTRHSILNFLPPGFDGHAH